MSKTIIISVIIAFIFFLVAVSIGGYFVWQNYFAEDEAEQEVEEKTEKNSSKLSPSTVIRDKEGYVDCGTSGHGEESFDETFMNINFNLDEAFSCLGENYSNNCSKSRMVIVIDGVEISYQFIEQGSVCYARMEIDNPATGLAEWVQCPVSSLASLIDGQASAFPGFEDLKKKISTNNGNLAASYFTVLGVAVSGQAGSLEDFGCQVNF
jgi:hypothetical protein